MKIKDFISHIKKNGISKQNRYNVIFSVPNLVREKLGKDIQSLDILLTGISLTAQSVNIPGYNISAQEAIHQNSTRKVIWDKSEGEFDITFLSTGNMIEKKLFDVWKQIIFRSDHTVEYYDEYISDIQIQILNENDEIIYETTITECYPATVGQIALDRTSRDSIQTFNVVFNFRKVKTNNNIENNTINKINVINSSEISNNFSPSLQTNNTFSNNMTDKFSSEMINVLGEDIYSSPVQKILKNTKNSLEQENLDLSIKDIA